MASDAPASRGDERMLVFAPTGRDAALTGRLLERAGIAWHACAGIDDALAELAHDGAGGLLLAEEALTSSAIEQLGRFLEHQPPWSDLPIIVFTGRREELAARPRIARLLDILGNVTLLDRPVRPITMISAVRSSLRARRRQYAARAELLAQQTAVRQRDEFLAMLGHELRNPLGAVLLALEVLERRGGDEPKYRGIVRRQVTHLGRLVDDLLDVTRLTTGKISLQPVVVDLCDVIHRSVQAHEAAVRTGGLAITVDVPRRPVTVLGDPVRMDQVLANLLGNAIKYTPAGGRIEIGATVDGDDVVVRVRDSGVGLSPEMLERVFDLFVQADATVDRARGGLGIGLTLVRKLVELHGGTVVARSDGLGHGSEMVVRLPRAAVDEAPVAEPLEPPPPTRRNILLVEDNVDACDALRDLLEHLGHRVEAAADGPSAVDLALAHRPAVLIIDIGLPGFDGYEVARRIRAHLGGSVVLIAMTGYGQPEDRRRAFDAGFDHHLTKPVDPRAIGRLLS